jgi:hypothetical protein
MGLAAYIHLLSLILSLSNRPGQHTAKAYDLQTIKYPGDG